VDSGDACGIRVLKTGIAGRLNLVESREKIISKTPAAANAPRVEKAICARTFFCWRMR